MVQITWTRSLPYALLLFHFFPIEYYNIIISLRKCLIRKEVFNNIFKEVVFSESGEKWSCEGGAAQRSCRRGLEMQLVRQKLQRSGERKTFMGSAQDMEMNLGANRE